MSKNRCPKLSQEFKNKPCIVCGNTRDTVGDHILRVGSRPDLGKSRFNYWPLCYVHHMEKEGKSGRGVHGLTDFVNKYGLHLYLFERGFEFDDNSKKWYYPEGK